MYNHLYNTGYSPYTTNTGAPGGNSNAPNGQAGQGGYASYYSYPNMYSSPYVTQPPQPAGQQPMYPSQQSQQQPGYGYGYNMGYGHAQGGDWNGGGQQRPPPPESYVCHKCNQKGHWITDCRQSAPQQAGGSVAQQAGGAGDRKGGKRGGARNGQQQGGSQRGPQGGANRQNAMGGGSKGGLNVEEDDEDDEDDAALDGLDEEDEDEDGAGNDEEDAKFFCEPCEKGFPVEAQYQAHLASHAKCTSPGCEFSGSKRVLLAHYRASHGKYKGSGFRVFTVEGRKYRLLVGEKDEEVEQWRDERRKNFPTSSNIAKRNAERQAAGIGPNGKKRPRWGVKTTMASPPGATEAAAPEPVNKVAKTEQGASAGGGLLGLVSGYGSSDEEEGAIGEKADGLKGQTEGQGQVPAPPSEQPQPSSQQPSEQQERSVLYGVCRAFLRGQCNSGNHCRYRHGPQKRGGPLYCRFFTRPNGVCREAASCKYVHDEELKKELSNWVDERRASNQQQQQTPNGEAGSQGEAGSASATNSTPQQQQQQRAQQQQQQRQRQQQPNKGTPRNSQPQPKRESTLLRKLLGVEADRETRLVLECIRFLVGTNFLRGHKQVEPQQEREQTGGAEAGEVEEEAVASTAMAVDCH